MQHNATQCNTVQHQTGPLQHTVTYCNTLQHTATHSNTRKKSPAREIWNQKEHPRKISHIWMRKIAYTNMNESCHTYEWVMSHIWMSHVAHMNKSRHLRERFGIRRSILRRCRGYAHRHLKTKARSAVCKPCQKSPICMLKEPYMHVKRALYACWKSPTGGSLNETLLRHPLPSEKSNLGMYNRDQKSPTPISNELYMYVKRALYACWKSPMCISKEPYLHV